MNYPVWYLPEIGGGTLIALIAVLHVFVSHFAVGGGLYLIYAEKKGLRESNQAILDFVKMHARFFLLLTMVFGSITGVGIWFVIALVNPAATSFLIHNFVFGWAAEWVFFLVEIAAAFVFYYMFGKMDWKDHLQVGWLYFIAAWMSLFLINGIICAMLTPGEWAETGDFWQGFFNPSFFPSLLFRTFIAVLLAGCYGYLSASWSKDQEVKKSMTRFSGIWALVAFVGAVPSAIWYVAILPSPAQGLVLGKSPTIVWALQWGAAGVGLLLVITLLAGIARPGLNNKAVACVAMICGLMTIGAFEWVREAARRPYVINEVIYSNGIFKKDVEPVGEKGFLASAIWVRNKELTEKNRISAGKELFIQQCYACHTLGGNNNDIVGLTENMSYSALSKYIQKIHEVRYFMPPFVGTEDEAKALAAYIAGGIHKKEIVDAKPAADDPVAQGKALFEESCSSCHALDDVSGAFSDMGGEEIGEMLLTLDEISDEMEPYSGTDQQRGLLAGFLQLAASGEEPVPTVNGQTVFEDNCSACHAAEDLAETFGGVEQEEIRSMLATLDEISDEMMPFDGSEAEAAALADYLNALKGGN